MNIKIKRLTETAKLPTYATEHACGFDLYADLLVTEQLWPDLPVVIPTGIAVEIPEGYGLLILSRSGHGFKEGVRLSNCVGLIDSDYRGEIKVSLIKDTEDGNCLLEINDHDRIAQGIIVPIPRVNFVEVDELSETVRGENGFGHTG